ncbi:MAG: hypothetical protein ACP5VP_08350 [Candidatus Limnocylindrales bacterium]
MRDVTLIVFHRPPRSDDPPLNALLAEARQVLLQRHVALFRRAGAARVVLAAARGVDPADFAPATQALDPVARPPAARAPAIRRPAGRDRMPGAVVAAPGGSFGEALAGLVRRERIGACVVLGSGSVPRLRLGDARRLVTVAESRRAAALTNNRYSSDVCAVSRAAILAELPPLPSDNALPRWLQEVAGYRVRDLPGRERLALDLDTPLDLALLARAADAPAQLRNLAEEHGMAVPRLEELRGVAGDRHRELLVFGRSSSRTLAWLERHVRCRVRFLAEERGLRAASPLAMRPSAAPPGAAGARSRAPRATLGRLLADRGPGALPEVVAQFADAALLDSRVLLADRLGPDEAAWPADQDRFASDLLQAAGIHDDWLRTLTAAAAAAPFPILLGGHTLVGPGVRLLLRGIR